MFISFVVTLAMVAAMAAVTRDVPPYMMVIGIPARVINVNALGLRRAGIAPKVRAEVRAACKLLYRSTLNQSNAIKAVEGGIDKSAEVQRLLDFVRNTRKGINGRGNEASR